LDCSRSKVETEVRAAIAVGEHIAPNAIDDSLRPGTNRRQRVEQLIAAFDGDRHLRAQLFDRDGRVLLASKPESPKDVVPVWFQRLVSGESMLVQVKLPTELGVYASIVLITDPDNELAEAWSETGLALTVLATFCTLVLAVVYWTLARGLRPLQNLSVAFARVGRGDYSSSVAENGPVKFVRIGREFNQMVTRLSTMKLEKDHLNEQLRNVQEEERASLARELHDEIGAFLFAVGLDVSTIHQIARNDPPLQLELAPRLTRNGVHRCSARWARSVPVKETHEGDAVWEGVVHVFDFEGHPTATSLYAWSSPIEGTPDQRRFFAVLHQPRVTSPAAAVRASIAVEQDIISN
jgi:hypothetical protein